MYFLEEVVLSLSEFLLVFDIDSPRVIFEFVLGVFEFLFE